VCGYFVGVLQIWQSCTGSTHLEAACVGQLPVVAPAAAKAGKQDAVTFVGCCVETCTDEHGAGAAQRMGYMHEVTL
jgi:hypothetical protein